MNIIRKIKFYREYRRTIFKHKAELRQKFNIGISTDGRLYGVLNIPKKTLGEPYTSYTMDSLDPKETNQMIDKVRNAYISEVFNYLNEIELRELYTLYNIERGRTKYEFVIYIGFSLFNTINILKPLTTKYLPMLGLILLASLAWIFLPQVNWTGLYEWLDVKKMTFIGVTAGIIYLFSRKKK